MNTLEQQIEEIFQKWYDNHMNIRDLRDVAIMEKDLTNLVKQREREAVEGFAKWYDLEIFPERGYAEHKAETYLKERERDE